MSYRIITDGDGDNAKGCLVCGKIFYVGEDCPFCTVFILHCTKCGRAKTGSGRWTMPLNALKDALDSFCVSDDNAEIKKISHIYAMCEDCKDEDLCKTPPIAICNER